jgi:hypothetical protein
MHGKEEKPPIEEKHRIPLRVAAIVGAYALYFFLSRESTAPAVFIGLGVLLVAFALIDRWTLWRRDRSGLMQVGMTVLGLGLFALGLYLFLGGDRQL